MSGFVASLRVSRLLTVVPLLGCGANFAHAAEQAGGVSVIPLREVQITATRVSEAIDYVPASLTVIHGEDLRRLGASDLRTALATVAGVAGCDASPGGYTGPAGSVPSLWGLHEFDAFLLVVDGVPWGGAFNPAVTTLNFAGTERIEVLKGAAPVMYGPTSFVGVVHVIHYPAGKAADEADLAYGNYGSVRGSASLVLPETGNYRQSLAIDGQNTGYADAREAVSNQWVLYRGALDLG